MEGMPVSQHLHHETQQPSIQTQAGSFPQQSPQQPAKSLDSASQRVPARPSSAFLKRRDPNKKVSWDNSVVDNEKAPKSPSVRPPTPPLLKKVTVVPKGTADSSWSQKLSTSTAIPVSAANTSAKMYSPSVRHSQSARPSGQNTYAGPDPWYQAHPANQQIGVSGSPPTHIPSGSQPNQAPAANSALKRKPNPASKDHVLEIKTSTSKGVRRTKIQRPARTTSGIPPAVPDAPEPRMQGPPPTPRITRLPTPDLPGVSGTTFCTCDATNCNKLVHLWTTAQERRAVCNCDDANCKKPFHTDKMDIQSKTPSGPSTQ